MIPSRKRIVIADEISPMAPMPDPEVERFIAQALRSRGFARRIPSLRIVVATGSVI